MASTLWISSCGAPEYPRLNGCSTCVDAHEKVVREKGLSEEAVLAAIRLASVIHGLATALDAKKSAPLNP
jgi:alkyl hydroperoxide reductase subunit D